MAPQVVHTQYPGNGGSAGGAAQSHQVRASNDSVLVLRDSVNPFIILYDFIKTLICLSALPRNGNKTLFFLFRKSYNPTKIFAED